MASFFGTLPLTLYVHIPWCVRKCPYCDFNSHQVPEAGQLPESRYVEALLGDLEHDLAEAPGRELQSVFIGGGTPSLFSARAIDDLLTQVRSLVACSSALEVTLEANPGTIEHGRFAEYRSAGISRVSLGAQTFNDGHLKRLGRIHAADDVTRAVGELEAAGISNFNLDLMFALPDQTVAEAIADVAAAMALEPAHISHYQLTLEPGTVFHHRPPAGLPDADTAWEMQVACQSSLADQGFGQYEVSAYAQPGRRCAHNLNYWQFGDYLGVGAGAHGKTTDAATGQVLRTTRLKQPREYLGAASPATRLQEARVVDPAELPFEFVLNALRLREGFTVGQFEARTGLSIDVALETLRDAESRGLLTARQPDSWVPSELGWRFLNDLQALFLPRQP